MFTCIIMCGVYCLRATVFRPKQQNLILKVTYTYVCTCWVGARGARVGCKLIFNDMQVSLVGKECYNYQETLTNSTRKGINIWRALTHRDESECLMLEH